MKLKTVLSGVQNEVKTICLRNFPLFPSFYKTRADIIIMGYRYSPSSKDEQARSFLNKRGRQLAVSAVIIFLLTMFYFTGNALTGYITYSSDLESQLNNAKNALVVSEGQKDSCQTSLGNTKAELNACNNNIVSAKTDLEKCSTESSQFNKQVEILNGKLKDVSSSLDECKSQQASLYGFYDQLARSSIKPICCSFGDEQLAALRNWNIINNSIVCNGNYTVNCSSGESNY